MGTAASMLDKVERIHQFEDLEERIQELKLAKSSEEKIFPLVRYNTEHFYFYKLAVQSLLLLHTNNYRRCSEVLANLHCWSLKKVPESDEVASLFEEFLSEISFCNAGFKKYKSLLQTFKIKSFGEAKKNEIPEDNKKIVPPEVLEVVLNLRRIWLLFSRPGKKFAKQLASFGVVYELAMEIRKMQANDENLTREDHAATETAFGIILNIAKMKEKPIAMKDSKLLNALDKIVGNQSGYILNVMALVILVLSTDGAMKRRIPHCEHQIDPLLLLTMSALKNNNYTENPTAADLIKTLAALCSMSTLWSKLSKSKQTLHKICQEIFTKANEQLKDQHPDVHEALTVQTLIVIREMLKNLGEKEIANYSQKINACASDSNEKIKKVAKDILWQLNKKNTNSFESDENLTRITNLRKKQQRRNLHVMISYCHAEADFAKKLNKKLTDCGIKTWIDEKDIRKQGLSTLDAMAEAVENSAVVLVCCSRNYLQSRSCQMEAEYAHTQHIPLKFLMVQEGYLTPTGWLGILLRAHMYYNFTLPPNFDETFATLVEKIKKECKDNPMCIVPRPATVEAPAPVIIQQQERYFVRSPSPDSTRSMHEECTQTIEYTDLENEETQTEDKKLEEKDNKVKSTTKVTRKDKAVTAILLMKQLKPNETILPTNKHRMTEEYSRILTQVKSSNLGFKYTMKTSGQVSNNKVKLQDTLTITMDGPPCCQHKGYNHACAKCAELNKRFQAIHGAYCNKQRS